MLLPVVVALALACSIAQQNCPTGQFCSGTWDNKKAECPDQGSCAPIPTVKAPELSLPVPAGERVFCAKGNLRVGADSHNACNTSTRFGFDLASLGEEPPHVVLASADGIAYPTGDCNSKDLNNPGRGDTCNGGWGNVVRVQHEGGVYTQYAHLSAILVAWGEPVVRGKAIGIEGNTGNAGPKHIHWSLHTGDAAKGDGPSVPMPVIRISGQKLASLALKCGDWGRSATLEPDPASALVSENAQQKVVNRFGYNPIESIARRIFSGDRRARLLSIDQLRKMPPEGETLYWLGAALQAEHQFDESRRSLEFAILRGGGVAWLKMWAELRLAEIDLALKHDNDARKHADLARASALKGDKAFDKRFDELLRALK